MRRPPRRFARDRRGAPANLLLVALKHVEGATAYGAYAQEAYLDRFHVGHGWEAEKSGAVAFSPALEKLGHAVDGLAQIVLVRQEHDAEVLVVRVVEPGALHQHHARFLQQLQEHLLVVLDRVHLRVELREHVQCRLRLDTANPRYRRNQVVGDIALATQPAIVLADEPTANLDRKTGDAILELMREINRTMKTTFIFSTHDKRVMSMADRLVRIEDGELTALGVQKSPGEWSYVKPPKSAQNKAA